MAEEDDREDGDSGAENTAGKKRKINMVLLISCGLLFLVLAVGVPAAYFMLAKKDSAIEKLEADILEAEENNVQEEGWEDEEEYDENEEPLGAIFPLHTFVVNLASNDSYLRCQVQLEFKGQTVPKRFFVRQVPIRDALLKLLASRTPEELASGDGRQELKESVKQVVNDMLKREEVKEVYFTQFVMQ
jgi:flagellar FliL protein